MPTYYINEHLLSSKVRTVIKDEKGNPVFLLVGKWGTKGDVMSIFSLDGKMLAHVKQHSFTIQSRFELYMNHEKVGVLSRVFRFTKDFYWIKGLKWVVVGDIPNQTYGIYRLNKEIMSMRKCRMGQHDMCEIVVQDVEQAPLCLCIASILDYWVKKDSKEKGLLLNTEIQPDASV